MLLTTFAGFLFGKAKIKEIRPENTEWVYLNWWRLCMVELGGSIIAVRTLEKVQQAKDVEQLNTKQPQGRQRIVKNIHLDFTFHYQ